MFDENPPQNLREVHTGMSYITEDIVISKHIVQEEFEEKLSDEANADPDGPEHLKFTGGNLSQLFLYCYKNKFESQIRVMYDQLVPGIFAEDDAGDLKLIKDAVKHALCVKKL